MDKLKALAVDVRHSVFENETEAMMYVVRDIYSADTQFIFSIPVYTFSISVKEENFERDLEQAFKYENLFQGDRKERLKSEMKRIVENWFNYYN